MAGREGYPGDEEASPQEIERGFTTVRNWLIQHGTYHPDPKGDHGSYRNYPILDEGDSFRAGILTDDLLAHVPGAAAALVVGDDGLTVSYYPPHARRRPRSLWPDQSAGARYKIDYGQVVVGVNKSDNSPYELELLHLMCVTPGTFASDRVVILRSQATGLDFTPEQFMEALFNKAALNRTMAALPPDRLTRSELQAVEDIGVRLDMLARPL